MDSTRIIILAAGKGTRIKNHLPKALVPAGGIPMLMHVLNAVEDSRVSAHPAVVVVGHEGDQIKNAIGAGVEYAHQREQRGTADAVRAAREMVRDARHILVLYADHPLLSGTTIAALANAHLASDNPLTMATTEVPHWAGWYHSFERFGRILRNDQNRIIGVRERKDASTKESEIREVNPSYFCFESDWLWNHIDKIGLNNTQHEFYLTDLVEFAAREGRITSVAVSPIEALGVNTPEERSLAEEFILERDARIEKPTRVRAGSV